jgi:hypothetical protein
MLSGECISGLTGRRMDGTKRGCGFGGTTSTRKVLDSGRLNFW